MNKRRGRPPTIVKRARPAAWLCDINNASLVSASPILSSLLQTQSQHGFGTSDMGWESLPNENEGQSIHENDMSKTMKIKEHPHREFIIHCDEIMDQLLLHKGRQGVDAGACCEVCQVEGTQSSYKCDDDCMGGRLSCKQCCLEAHLLLPFHRIKAWDGQMFQGISLQDLGLVIQLGHQQCRCPNPRVRSQELSVIHTNGLHTIDVRFCDCHPTVPPHTQLLQSEWYPATFDRPQTCASFALLRNLQILSSSSKVSTMHFNQYLERITDNTKAFTMYRYRELLHMLHQWRYLKALMRSGRSLDPSGSKGTAEGELAVRCAACPQPGVNLPPTWESAPDNIRYIYRLFLAVDANFRLKSRRLKLGFLAGLGTGNSYMVADAPYAEYLKSQSLQKDVSTCSGLSAIDHANTKSSKGLRATGVGASTCARHGFMLPCGLGDLQKGERYCNMDYILWSSLKLSRMSWVLVSYDIACQWIINLPKRLPSLPRSLQPNPDRLAKDFDVVIPKLHIEAHTGDCRTVYSLNYRPGCGRTDGEGVERGWSGMNPAANSTKEMSSGFRADTLDEFWGDWNYMKFLKFGPFLSKKLTEALAQQAVHDKKYDNVCAGGLAQWVPEWEIMVNTWEADCKKPNPYEMTKKYQSLADVRLECIELETELHRTNESAVFSASMSAAAFLLFAYEVEKAQFKVATHAQTLPSSPTSTQRGNLKDARLALSKQIAQFREAQRDFMPQVDSMLHAPDEYLRSPESEPLLLPHSLSNLPALRRVSLGLDTLAIMESKLRFAICIDSLSDLRRSLRVLSQLLRYKVEQVRGIAPNTRANELVQQAEKQVNTFAERYRHSRQAFCIIGGDWELFKVLAKEDVRMHGVTEEAALDRGGTRTRQGYTTLSWIWTSDGVLEEGDPAEFHDCLRVEWAKARARKLRWNEEVLLLREEMRRVLVFCESRAKWWEAKIHLRKIPATSALHEGARAYGCRQAYVLRQRAAAFGRLWQPLTEFVSTDAAVVGEAVEDVVDDAASSEDEDYD